MSIDSERRSPPPTWDEARAAGRATCDAEVMLLGGVQRWTVVRCTLEPGHEPDQDHGAAGYGESGDGQRARVVVTWSTRP